MASNSRFELPPFGSEGAALNFLPDAVGEFRVVGEKRRFLLKTRDDLLFFKEAKRNTIYAVPEFLPREMALETDAGALCNHLQSALDAGQIARYVVRHQWFPKVGGATVLCILHRADRSGWVKEWFSDTWTHFGALPPAQHLDLHAPRLFLHYANRRAANHLLPKLLQITFEPPERRNVRKTWLRGDARELERVVLAILRLFEPKRGPYWGAYGLALSPCNAFSSGTLQQNEDSWPATPYFHAATRRLMDIVEEHFAFCELKWRSHRVKRPPSWSSYYDEKLIEAGNEKFGPNWRGNWYLEISRHAIEIPAYSLPSAHEKLEDAMTLKAWLQPKVTPTRIQTLLRPAFAAP